jgi:hypothetical protein
VRSSSISCATSSWRASRAAIRLAAAILAIAALALASLTACAGAGAGGAAAVSMGELINPFLGPDYSDWLVGPVARIASAGEIKTYLGLHDDREAAAFIAQFWDRRNPAKGPRPPAGAATGAGATAGAGAPGGSFPPLAALRAGGNTALALFEERAGVADKKFSEGGVIGRHTDRGIVLVLYGAPKRGGFEVAPSPNDPPIEVWEYSPDAPAGLDGKRPERFYRFAKRGDLTVTYVPRPGSRLAVPRTPP